MSLAEESKRLEESWSMDRLALRDYLVQNYHDPRINIQSVITRHFLIQSLFGSAFQALCEREMEFAIQSNISLNDRSLRRDALLLELLASGKAAQEAAVEAEASARLVISDAFQKEWSKALASAPHLRIRLIEPACGSANDYRYFDAYGLAPFLDYTGLDISLGNIQNAKEMFPDVTFLKGNFLEVDYADNAFDYAIVHDFFEHLSLEALEIALMQLMRITRYGIAIAFFNMHDGPQHEVVQVRKYHWNRLSREKVARLFQREGWQVEVRWVASWLAENYHYHDHENPHGCSFFCSAAS